MIGRMARGCSSCGGALRATDALCPHCGAKNLPDLELPLPARTSAKPPGKARAKPEEEISLELAVDPRALIQERASGGQPPAVQVQPMPADAMIVHGAAAAASLAPPQPQAPPAPAVGDLAFDARLLADYGDPPSGILGAPFYAWRVLRRQRELKAALATRREEAARAENDRLDALVAFAERVRPTAEKQPAYAVPLEELRRGEEVLRSRDRVLAAEQDAQNARLGAVDARLSKLEAELAEARGQEAALETELAAAQGALSREEAKLKRAEVELKAAQQREASGEAN